MHYLYSLLAFTYICRAGVCSPVSLLLHTYGLSLSTDRLNSPLESSQASPTKRMIGRRLNNDERALASERGKERLPCHSSTYLCAYV